MSLFCENLVSKVLHKIDLTQCRLCQEKDGSIEFITNLLLFERIKLYTRINFEIGLENLPKLICTKCNELINNFFQFQENCLKIDEQLKQLLRKTSKDELKCRKTSRGVKRPVLKKREPIKNKALLETEPTEVVIKPEIIENESIKCDDPEWIKIETPCSSPHINDLNELTEDEKPEDIEENLQETKVEQPSIKVKKPRKKKEKGNQPESYSCPITGCTKTCPNKGALRSHKYHQHGIRKFLCTACGKSFRALCNLKSHEAVHLQNKPFQCPKCSQCFGYATNLKVHIKNHHEGHRYYCTKCGKAFLTSCTLKRHELIHVGKKDFKCDVCPSAFYTQKELMKHQKYHYDIRAYFCNICYKTFVAKDHLTVHMRSHTGERPYICDVNGCGQAFVTSGKVRRHQRTVHRLNL